MFEDGQSYSYDANGNVLQRAVAGDNDNDGLADPLDPDDDNDGMPDAYEISNALDPLNPADAGEGAAGDGFTNFAEFEGDTDPNDPASRPITAMPWIPLLIDE